MVKNLLTDHFFDEQPLGKLLDLTSMYLISDRAEQCPLQDPYRIRARYLGWKAASLLIDEKGELQRESLQILLHELEATPFFIVQSRDGDERLYHHLLACLRQLAANEAIWKAIKKCSLPLCNKKADEIVRDSLWPEQIKTVQTPHVRRAALSAWLTLLRQIVGSCFATAPAILIQEQSPLLFFQDLEMILSAGTLRRNRGSVPMNPVMAKGELNRPFGGWPALLSPGLHAGFHAAGLSADEYLLDLALQDTPQKVFSGALMQHFGLSKDDILADLATPSAQLSLMWERGGGHFIGLNAKTKQINEYKASLDKAERAFCSLADCALLRCWEYTVASFSDVKEGFGNWNLFVAIGLQPEIPGGVGSFFYDLIQEALNGLNLTMTRLQGEHLQAVGNVRVIEGLLQRSGNESRRTQLKGEIIAALHEVNRLEQRLDATVAAAQWLSELFSSWIQEVARMLQTEFQEVFDPALFEQDVESLEDSPAGFRLIFKHGRAAASSWERIENKEQFVEAVYHFFESIEHEWIVEEQNREKFVKLMTQILQFIRSDAFLEGAMKRAHENPIKKNATPWSYRSGGTMQTLVHSYFDRAPLEFSRPIGSEKELLEFLVEGAEKSNGKSPLLMHSPTHAFLFYPAWLGKTDRLHRSERFLKEMSLSGSEAEFLAERFSARLPESIQPLFYYGYRQSHYARQLADVRQSFLLGADTAGISSDFVDSFLYESLPLCSSQEVRRSLEKMAKQLDLELSIKIEEPQASFVTSSELIEMMKQAIMNNRRSFFSSIDWEFKIAEAARICNLVYPQPILFGDTNWSDYLFGFVRDFGTCEWQLWRLNRTALRGAPMKWKSIFLDRGNWTIYTDRG